MSIEQDQQPESPKPTDVQPPEKGQDQQSDWESKYSELKAKYEDLGGDDASKWRNFARKNESEAKKLREQSMSEQEKLVAQAREEGMKEARSEAAKQLAAARALAALTGLTENPQAIVDDMNMERLIDPATGDVSDDAIEALREKYSAILPKREQPAPDLAHGVRKNTEPDQLTRADLKSMPPEKIMAARAEGRLDSLLGYSR